MTLATAAGFAVANWPLNEASGNAIDSLTGNDGTDTNTVGSGTGIVHATARDFESGSTEYFSVADSADISLGADEEVTFTVWFKTESQVAIMVVFSKDDGSTDREYGLYLSSSGTVPSFYVFDSGGSIQLVNWGSTVSNGAWHLAVCGHSPSADQVWISIDGGDKVTIPSAGGTRNQTAALLIGNGIGTSLPFDGLINDLVMMKGYTFSDAEIDELWNSGSGVAFEDWGGGGGGVTGPLAGDKHLLGGGILTGGRLIG